MPEAEQNSEQKEQLAYVRDLMRLGGFASATAFARAAKVSPSTLNRKFAGEDDTLLSWRTMRKLEGAARTTSGLGRNIIATAGVSVIGSVQAGEWRDALEWPEEEQYRVGVPAEFCRGLAMFALEVRGPSMNRVYEEGTIIVCSRLTDLGRNPISGERVVVLRHNKNGLVEATVKTLRIDGNGERWLWPESDHPEHQAPLRLDETEDIDLLALVIGRWAVEANGPWQ